MTLLRLLGRAVKDGFVMAVAVAISAATYALAHQWLLATLVVGGSFWLALAGLLVLAEQRGASKRRGSGLRR